MLEKEYRLQRLRKRISEKKITRYGIYGIGINAEILVSTDIGDNALFLIDEGKAGQYLYGKKVLSINQAIRCKISAIIIAAEPKSSLVIEERIYELCNDYGIDLLNIYGTDVISYKNKLTEYQCNYPSLTMNGIRRKMEEKKCLCFSLSCLHGIDVAIWGYAMLCQILFEAVNLGKSVYLLSEEAIDDESLTTYHNAGQIKQLIDAKINDAIYGGLIRDLVGERTEDALVIAFENDPSIYMAGNYDIDWIQLKDSKSFLFEVSCLHIDINRIHYDREKLLRWFTKNFKSTLYEQRMSIAEGLNKCSGNLTKTKSVYVFSTIIPRGDRDAGSKTIINYMKLLVDKGYKVSFLAQKKTNDDSSALSLSAIGVDIIQYQGMYDNLSMWIVDNSEKIDLAFVHYPDVAYEIIPALTICGIKIVYYGHDLHFARLKRQFARTNQEYDKIKSNNYLKKEIFVMEHSDSVCYPSAEEVDIIQKELGVTKAKRIVPYIFDLSKQNRAYNPADRNGIMFIGSKFAPNNDAARWLISEIFPMIEKLKDITLYLVGGLEYPNAQLNRKIKVLGYVSDSDLQKVYDSIRIVVVPLRFGAGVKGKVVDALYQGIPVISTDIGIEGIPEAEDSVKIANSTNDFANAVLDLYDDFDLLKDMSIKGTEIIKKYFSKEAAWDSIKDDF